MDYFGIKDKVFKVVADQGANVKKAFKTTTEFNQQDVVLKITESLLKNQNKIDSNEKQKKLREALEVEIDTMNSTTSSTPGPNKTKEQIYTEMMNGEFSEYTESNDGSLNNTLDCDEFNKSSEEIEIEDESDLVAFSKFRN